MLKYLCEYNPDSTASTTYHNKLYENDTKTTVHDQLYYNNKYKYTLKSYLNGATIENGYTPTLPISITVTEDPGGTVEATTGYPKKLRFSFQSAGADAARYVDMFYSTKNKRWYVWGETWKYMLQSVRDPVVQWLAEYPSVPAGRTMQQPTYVRTEKVLKDFEFIDNITDEPRKEDVTLAQYTFTFPTLPRTLGELMQFDLSDPETGGYLTTCLALLIYDNYVPQDGELYGDKTSNESLNEVYAMLQYLCDYNPDSSSSTNYHNKLFESDTKTFVHDRLAYNDRYKYTLNSYKNGASVSNEYTPDQPVSITVNEYPYSMGEATAGRPKQIRFTFTSAGADGDRFLEAFYDGPNNRWFIYGTTWKYPLSAVRDPVPDEF